MATEFLTHAWNPGRETHHLPPHLHACCWEYELAQETRHVVALCWCLPKIAIVHRGRLQGIEVRHRNSVEFDREP